ncbi:MAG: hypothetical protein HOP17_01515 [Acidobacteria bacterium]|nr:hypothetical protein [Acidobacteriota bacterium]
MIERAAIEQIIAQYEKHGWSLRRVLLSKNLGNEFDDGLFGDAASLPSELDGLWFSRSSRPDSTAWELRHLSDTPYALVAGVPAGRAPAEADLILKETEARMLAVVQTRKTSAN